MIDVMWDGITMWATLKSATFANCGVSKVERMSKLSVACLKQGESVEIFPDELLSLEFEDVIDLLRAELAPLKTWRKVAVRKTLRK